MNEKMQERLAPWLATLLSILIALAVGGLATLLTQDSMEAYASIPKSKLSPPGAVFPVVWSALYILMGISAARIYLAHDSRREKALALYGFQLVVNFLWSIFFFRFQAYGVSFFWLLFLWVLVFLMIRKFFLIDRPAAWLQIPYLIWLTFAAYLSCEVWIFNL